MDPHASALQNTQAPPPPPLHNLPTQQPLSLQELYAAIQTIENRMNEAGARARRAEAQAAATSQARTNRSSLKTSMPVFKGTYLEDVRSWMSIVEDQLRLHNVPYAEWAIAASSSLKDEALSWYIELKKTNGDRAPTWTQLTRLLIQKADSPYRVDELRARLLSLRYKDDIPDYIERFRQISTQIRNEEMTFGDRKAYFLRNLPGEIARRIRQDRPSTLEEVFDAARDWDRIANLSRRRRIADVKSRDADEQQFYEEEEDDRLTDYTPYHIDTSVAPPPDADDDSSPMDLDTLHIETRRLSETRRRKVRRT